jgi:hypothetical protein
LFCAASRDIKVEQSSTYFEDFRRFKKPRWQSSTVKYRKLIERLEKWTEEVIKKKE